MPLWNVAAAQYAACPGGVEKDILHHLNFIRHAAHECVDLLIFPEDSLLCTDDPALPPDSPLLLPVRQAAIHHGMTIVVGLPHRDSQGVPAGALSFMPDGERISCRKPHAETGDWFTPCPEIPVLGSGERSFALAVNTPCHEEALPRSAAGLGANLYATGGFVSEANWQHDVMYLQRWAHKYGMAVLMANKIEQRNGGYSVGRSALWDEHGQLVVRAEQDELLVIGRRTPQGWQGEVVPVR
ncbi:carbon-nitrogen hydrolase family protein [Erwinia sp. CPCC 100877]|nr:carbon-nitrogen hydrolase family protein [Erwinia sp. CPCC 100877]